MENIKKLSNHLSMATMKLSWGVLRLHFNWRLALMKTSHLNYCDIKAKIAGQTTVIVDDQIAPRYYGINVSVPDPDKVIERTITDSDVIKRLWHNHDAENSLHDQRKVESWQIG